MWIAYYNCPKIINTNLFAICFLIYRYMLLISFVIGMIIFIVVCALLLLACIVLFPTWYISELAISFPLYLVVGYVFLAIVVWFVDRIRLKWLIS